MVAVSLDVLRQRLNVEPLNSEISHSLSVGKIEFILPIRTVSEANCFEAWRKKHARHKAQKRAIYIALCPHKHLLRLPCTVRITRYGPRLLDEHDNLRIAVKYLLDAICEIITNEFCPGRADGKAGFTFEYAQEKNKKYSVKIEITI